MRTGTRRGGVTALELLQQHVWLVHGASYRGVDESWLIFKVKLHGRLELIATRDIAVALRLGPQPEADEVSVLRSRDSALVRVHHEPQAALDESRHARHHTVTGALGAA
jgi:hypothetical protein